MTDTILAALKKALEFAENDRHALLVSCCVLTRDGKPDQATLDEEAKPFVYECDALIAKLAAAIAAREAEGWQPIETAPRGTYRDAPGPKGSKRKVFVPELVDTWRESNPVIRTWWLANSELWDGYSKDFPPTHWRPMPAPPSAP